MNAEFFWVSLLVALVAAPFLGMGKQWKTAGALLGMAFIVPASVFYAQLTDPTISQSDRQMGSSL
jgi:hypothetical protein